MMSDNIVCDTFSRYKQIIQTKPSNYAFIWFNSHAGGWLNKSAGDQLLFLEKNLFFGNLYFLVV